jgi:DNA-binding transcriptional regulator YiaG
MELVCYDIYTMCMLCKLITGRVIMDFKDRIIALRERTGMTRKEFCDYFNIPYRTMTEWERDNRHAPEYVLRLLEYYIQMEKLNKEQKETEK